MSIEKISRKCGVSYRAVVRIERQKVSQSFKRRVDAELWESSMLVSRETGILKRPSPISLNELRNRFEREHAAARQSPSTRKLESALYQRHVAPILGNERLQNISVARVELFFAQLSKEHQLSNKLVNRVRTLLNGMFSKAEKWGYVSSNVIRRTDPLPIDRGAVDAGFNYFNREEADVFLGWVRLNDPWLYPKVRVMLNCGFRYGEMAGLGVSDFQKTAFGGMLRVSKIYCRHTYEIRNRTKGNRSRLFPLNNAMAEFLSTIAAGRKADEPLLWSTWEEGKHPIKFNQHFRRALRESGMKRIRVHDLRHSFAVIFLEGGGQLYHLQNLLGHSTSRLTERYSHFSQAMLEKSRGVVDVEGEVALKMIEGGATMSHKSPTNSVSVSSQSAESAV